MNDQTMLHNGEEYEYKQMLLHEAAEAEPSCDNALLSTAFSVIFACLQGLREVVLWSVPIEHTRCTGDIISLSENTIWPRLVKTVRAAGYKVKIVRSQQLRFCDVVVKLTDDG